MSERNDTATAAQTTELPRGEDPRDRVVLHFTSNDENWRELPTIVRGEGTRVYDEKGNEYFDGLGGLYTTQVGHGRKELARAAAEQIEKIEFYPNWSAHNEPVLKLTKKLTDLAPVDGPASAFFVNSGSEGVESALKLCRQYHAANGQPDRFKFISRRSSYHGVTYGAMALGGLAAIKSQFEPLPPGFIQVANTGEGAEKAIEEIKTAIEFGPAEQIAAIFLEPVQNAGGCLVPPPDYWKAVRAICDEHGILLVADATICGFGRLGTWFGVERFDVKPDIITFAKGLTSGYIPMGGLVMSKKVRDAIDKQAMYNHGATFGGHPVAAAVALANIELIENEGMLENVMKLESHFGGRLQELADRHPLVKDVRGMGFFWALEIDPAWKDGRELEYSDYLQFFKQDLFDDLLEAGLICRVDDRESPVIQLSPALNATAEEIDQLVSMLEPGVAALEKKLGWS
jgi:adenosylmethionine-8-amino-7-oxononanoate aminotransferase